MNSTGRIRFCTDALPQRDRFPAVREEFARRLLAIETINHNAADFSTTFDIKSVGRLALGYIDTSPSGYVRTPELIRDGQEFLFATLNHKGAMFASQPDGMRLISPREGVLLDAAHIGGVHFRTPASYLTIRIPREDVTRRLPAGTRLAGASMAADRSARQLLFSYLEATRDIDLNDSGEAARLYSEHILDLVSLALGADGEVRTVAEERGVRAARRSAVLRAIQTRSNDAALNAVAIAALLGVTPRYVHLLLEETGRSFSQHLLERRLEKTAVLLRDRRRLDAKIADIAAEAGFADLSYFNRAFRRRYGATPSDLRESARREHAEQN